MNFYAVQKNTHYLDRSGYDILEPIPMTKAEAELVALIDRGVVVEYLCEVVRTYKVPEPVLPINEICGDCGNRGSTAYEIGYDAHVTSLCESACEIGRRFAERP